MYFSSNATGTSETTRVESAIIKNYSVTSNVLENKYLVKYFYKSVHSICTLYKKKYPSWFEEWFVGFAEGDGNFYVDEKSRRFFFKIRQKDVRPLYYIRGYFNFGTVFLSKDGYWTFSVQRRTDVARLITIFNGKLCLDKTNRRFKDDWIALYNKWYAKDETASEFIVYKGIANFSSKNLTNAWLCVFTDADGSLGFKLIKKRGAPAVGTDFKRLRVYWYVDQTNENRVLYDIKETLGFGRIEKKYNSTGFTPNKLQSKPIRLITDSFSKCYILRSYFLQYPPITNKLRVRWYRWKYVLDLTSRAEWKHYLSRIAHLISLNKKL